MNTLEKSKKNGNHLNIAFLIVYIELLNNLNTLGEIICALMVLAAIAIKKIYVDDKDSQNTYLFFNISMIILIVVFIILNFILK
ncbi:hypothetical protein [Apilactobacillus timberlakei]|uniref:hypothetical protein n=1 Tax=Apilactobacillus timberlakei TaxID=2008380 RepID=UPI00112D7AD3|nr:hypothetical protein [Apilactobacillus timberlakei]TPR15884.1 hypothetical protein DYZ95_08020 [Apilactobacillus timberlakei]